MFRRPHRTFALILPCLLASGMLLAAGCSGGSISPDAAETLGPTGGTEPVTIQIGFNPPYEISREEIRAFERDNPDIRIETFDGQDYNKVMAMIAAGRAPDILRISGTFDFVPFVEKGYALNLEPYMAQSAVFDQNDFAPIANLFRYDGQVQGRGPMYGFVKDWSQDFTLWYNKKLFDEANVPYLSPTEPITWEELLAISKKLTKTEDGRITQYGFMPLGGAQMSQNLLLLQLAQLGRSPFSEDFSGADLTTPEAKRIMRYWKDVVDANVGANAVNQAQDKASDAWFDDKVAIMMSGNWFAGRIRNTEKAKGRLQDYGFAPAPVFEGGVRISPTGYAVGGVISKQTRHPDEAWRVFEWFFGGEPADERARTGVGLPAFKSKMPLLRQDTAWDREIFRYQSEEMKYADRYLPFNPYLSGTAMDSLIDQYFVPVYFGRSTVDEAAGRMTDALNLLIREGRQAAGDLPSGG
ncbi:ABC transporter substrate-binding protein [Cohnella caldifontis]|uniref:ABC transporter substrate-binding protein n=1 Tax=Cohnella caldifontis TaxID=3027471 RepID=UPI0023EAC0C8|nr:sugar ABC transporter substrate-binding protein [Cohnella sp. YIM B05605]